MKWLGSSGWYLIHACWTLRWLCSESLFDALPVRGTIMCGDVSRVAMRVRCLMG